MKFITDSIKSLLALFVTVCSFGYFFVTYFQGKAQSDPQIIIAIVAALTQVLNYYYGSSQSSSKKSETIANMASASKPTSTVNSADTVNVNTTNNPVKEDEEPKG